MGLFGNSQSEFPAKHFSQNHMFAPEGIHVFSGKRENDAKTREICATTTDLRKSPEDKSALSDVPRKSARKPELPPSGRRKT